ncbi:MAG: BREX-6 system adenine-specific DNA-methyltransferase PglX [Deltaproteobacteria bacterium]|nr:BREX-6 system adenine-specific DNA-methyltransferase PglX [Deltaproteobacteria bacterium]
MLTSEAKQLFARIIRELRARLLRDLHDAAESRYRLSVPAEKANLSEDAQKKRARLDAWLDERARTTEPKDKTALDAARARFRLEAEKEAAATFLNRIVLLRHFEALKLSKPEVVSGGWNSKGYRELRSFAPALLGDDTEGYAALLQLVFDELALDMPGLFGDVGLARLFTVPPATLREVVERLDDPALESAWTDDTTLGWVYQYWNDPEREALDAKLNEGGKIEPHEIASKTQMFTERYMVEWLLHNSLGLMWLCICKKNGWKADAEAILPVLDTRRAEWRKKREAGEVALDALMPIEGELEEHWKYFVPQPIPDDAVATAPASIRKIKLLDPACGSGHFLVIAFDLLAAMYREEARHREETISEREIAESILENNLHGIDIDPRSVQIAAAAVVTKAKRLAPNARPRLVNLVAPVLGLGSLPADDPALVRLRNDVTRETGIPEELTNKILKSLAGVDHLGSLLKVDAAIEEALGEEERVFLKTGPSQGDLLTGRFPAQQTAIDFTKARATVQQRLEQFLAHHAGEEDLGLRLDGEQLAAGIRFVRIVKEGAFDVVVGNPPYQGATKLQRFGYISANYPAGKPDLYSAFIERSLGLVRTGGVSALIAMRGWLFIDQFASLRSEVLKQSQVMALADLQYRAFEQVGHIFVSMFTLQKGAGGRAATAIRPTSPEKRVEDILQLYRNRAGVLAQDRSFSFDPSQFAAVEGKPFVYWWSPEFLERYRLAPKIEDESPARFGINTGHNQRFIREWWEVGLDDAPAILLSQSKGCVQDANWQRCIKGANGVSWIDPCDNVVRWKSNGLEVKVYAEHLYGSYSRQIRNESVYFESGIAFTKIGATFSARVHRYRSIIESAAPSVYPKDIAATLCVMNSSLGRFMLESLNPSINFQVGDVNRLAIFPVTGSDDVYSCILSAFEKHEAGRESSFEFMSPGASQWSSAQDWAQKAVDRAAGEALPAFFGQSIPPTPSSVVSYAVGVALGRFRGSGEGLVRKRSEALLRNGILFLGVTSENSALNSPACALLRAAWTQCGTELGEGDSLESWLRRSFFGYHKAVYENRPIYFPLSSSKRSFVAWVSIHGWTSTTLSSVLADHLLPEKRRLEGEIDDLRQAKAKGDKGGKAKAERRFGELQKLLTELTEFIERVVECAERGPPPASLDEPKREVDARFEMNLDDGVIVNSAALWPLLEPQWKDPKTWRKEIAAAKGRKDCDWAHLAKRYFPGRVEEKCKKEPSLAVAHGCFWRLHPEKAYAWELRLQDEIRRDFTIDEPGSDEARKAYLTKHADEAKTIREKEEQRRQRKAGKSDQSELFEEAALEGGDDEEVA